MSLAEWCGESKKCYEYSWCQEKGTKLCLFITLQKLFVFIFFKEKSHLTIVIEALYTQVFHKVV